MASLHHYLLNHLTGLDQGSVIVEIGTARAQGDSTITYAKLAAKFNTVLHAVDLDPGAPSRAIDPPHYSIKGSDYPNTVWHTAKGSDWAKNVWPTIGKKISVLSLDNYDYIWDVDGLDNPENQWIRSHIKYYKEKFNEHLNNTQCQIEHYRQMMYLLPWLSEQCYIVLDDTYMYNDCWIGKSGPVVVSLLAQGFKFLTKEPFYKPQEVILYRGI